ncbi:hypothetical protein A6E01_20735 (plasmid) [Vibrio breoganii]|uniref:Uncharacterized protein n=1 Tax=Vibrio breoganii TaxID=553239 RepID=A0AAN0XZS9_9VIBR|nr:hypothetical protein [Vibrio breoganii]ANO35640.1 hypothetical protein A6E01_20735 [Vibrio breoganii]PML19306.1 hypothetical protein BCT84_18705 [Vibrio breoganii]
MTVELIITTLGMIVFTHAAYNIVTHLLLSVYDSHTHNDRRINTFCSTVVLAVFTITIHLNSRLSADIKHSVELLCLIIYIMYIALGFYWLLKKKNHEIQSMFDSITDNSEILQKEEAIEIQEQYFLSKVNWLISLYADNSKCLFHSDECIQTISNSIKDKEITKAAKLLSKHLDLLLLDKFSDEYRPMIEALGSFGATHNQDELKLRVADSEVVAYFNNEKKIALNCLMTPKTEFIHNDIQLLIDTQDSTPAPSIATPMVDLYLYKTANGMEPSYRPVLLNQSGIGN